MNQSEDTSSLQALKQKIEGTQSERHEDEPTPSEASKIGRGMHMATELLAAVGVGGVMGYLIDSWAGTEPIFFIVLFFTGFAAGVRNILKSYQDLDS